MHKNTNELMRMSRFARGVKAPCFCTGIADIMTYTVSQGRVEWGLLLYIGMDNQYKGWLISPSLLKRSLAVMGHYIIAQLIIAVPLILVFVIARLITGN